MINLSFPKVEKNSFGKIGSKMYFKMAVIRNSDKSFVRICILLTSLVATRKSNFLKFVTRSCRVRAICDTKVLITFLFIAAVVGHLLLGLLS